MLNPPNLAGSISSSTPPSSTSSYNAYNAGQELCSSFTSAPSSSTVPSCATSSPGYLAGASATYGYNADGKRTCATPANSAGATCSAPDPSVSTTYGWNSKGELSSVASPSGKWGYQYNAQGLRASESSPLGIEQFTWNTESPIPQLLMDGANAYIYGPPGTPLGNAPIEQIPLSSASTTGSLTYLFSDPSGVRFTFNSAGTVTSGATYNAYGEVIAGGTSSPGVPG